MKIALSGFGRVGRCFLRAALASGFLEDHDLVAVHSGANAQTLAYLFKYDSVHGTLGEKVAVTSDGMHVGKHVFKVVSTRNHLELPWAELGVDVVVEATGTMKKREDCQKHLQVGAKKVLVTSPLEGADATIVPGVNDEMLHHDHAFISMASCTTNCLAPVAKIIDEAYGIDGGFLCTTHAYTNDQIILDSSHKDLARGRAAALSIIPTTTGAAKSIGKVVPSLQGKLDGLALRVPVPNGSMNDLVVQVMRTPSVKEVNALLKEKSEGQYQRILGYNEDPIVSSDVIGRCESAIVDSLRTMAIKNTLRVMAWYDNEWGYSNRICDLIDLMK